MRPKRRTHIPIRIKDRDKVNNLRRELAALEGRDVSQPEILRRTFKIPKLSQRLREDAMLKKRLRK